MTNDVVDVPWTENEGVEAGGEGVPDGGGHHGQTQPFQLAQLPEQPHQGQLPGPIDLVVVTRHC